MSAVSSPAVRPQLRRPRVGFLGVGWIGRNRMEAVVASDVVTAVALADPSDEMAAEGLRTAPGCRRVDDLDALLALQLDGIVIATPSADHAEQSIRCLDAGLAVFCQKPLGRTAREVAAVVAAAETADRLLMVDLSYRFTEAGQAIRHLVRSGDLGRVHAMDLTFHNAWGPDKPWFYDRSRSGGGCVMDLGVHLVDLALWTLGEASIVKIDAYLFAAGRPLSDAPDAVEDYAVATVQLSTGAVLRLTCSWNLHAGRDAVIRLEAQGSAGGALMHNVDGSFYEFTTERFKGTQRESVTVGPDPWSGRAAVEWARRLAAGETFDPEARRLVRVAEVLDGIYAAAQPPSKQKTVQHM